MVIGTVGVGVYMLNCWLLHRWVGRKGGFDTGERGRYRYRIKQMDKKLEMNPLLRVTNSAVNSLQGLFRGF